MVTFEIETERDVVSARLFEPDASSHLRFGWTARSTATATIGNAVCTCPHGSPIARWSAGRPGLSRAARPALPACSLDT